MGVAPGAMCPGLVDDRRTVERSDEGWGTADAGKSGRDLARRTDDRPDGLGRRKRSEGERRRRGLFSRRMLQDLADAAPVVVSGRVVLVRLSDEQDGELERQEQECDAFCHFEKDTRSSTRNKTEGAREGKGAGSSRGDDRRVWMRAQGLAKRSMFRKRTVKASGEANEGGPHLRG